jgi:soluble lytic murein transglycosylase-like protein
MMQKIKWYSVFMFAVVCAAPGTVQGDIFTYTDKDGVVHFTNIMPSGKKFKVFLKTPDSRKAKKGVIPVPAKDKSPERFSRYDKYVQEASELYLIPTALIKAVIKVESDYDPHVVSVAGAEGLMQLLPGTAKRMKVKDSFNPRQNIMGGTKYLRILANLFEGDLLLTIAGYHAGEGNVIKYEGIPPFKTTIGYIKRVLKYYVQYSNSV